MRLKTVKLLYDLYNSADTHLTTYQETTPSKRFLLSFSVLLFTKFPVGPTEEESKCWKIVKGKINDKCRATRFAHMRREGSENTRSN